MISGPGAFIVAIFLDLGTPSGIVVFLLNSFQGAMISGPGAVTAIFLDLGTLLESLFSHISVRQNVNAEFAEMIEIPNVLDVKFRGLQLRLALYSALRNPRTSVFA